MHAEIARELLRSGDPFRLTLNGVVYVDKPPLLYWLQAGAFTTFGASEATARSVSAAAGVAAVAGTAWLGARLLGVAGGCLAGGALLTSALFFAYARYVRPDALFVAALAWGFALALVGLAEGRRRVIGWGLVAFGIAGLAKDPLGALPWSLSAVVTIVRLLRARAWRQAAETPWIALSLWTLAILGITVLSRFRLPHYGLPVYPALALLAARAWREPDTRWLGLIHAALLGVLSVVGAVLARSDGRAFMDAVIGATDVATRKTRVAGETDPFPGWEMVQPLVAHASLVLGVATVALLIALALRGRVRTSMLAPGVVALAMLAIMPDVATALGAMSTYRSARAVATVVASWLGPGDVLAHEGPIEQSGALEWYSGRRPMIVDGRRSVLAFGATRPEGARLFWTAADLKRAWRE